jgi:hypothetical protein
MAGNNGNGRKKGVPNKNTQAVVDQLIALNCDPIEGMAIIAKKSMEAEDYATAGTMYKELAQYVAPKRKSIEVSGDVGLDIYSNILIEFQGMSDEIIDS